MRPSAFALLYWRRVRAQPLQEALTALGIATGVALIFAVLVANRSLTGSVRELTEGVAGNASVEVAARARTTFDARLAERIDRTPGVLAAAPLLERRATVVGPRAGRSVQILGIDRRLRSLARALGPIGQRSTAGLVRLAAPVEVLDQLGVRPGRVVTVQVGGRARRAVVSAGLSAAQLGALSDSPVALASLPDAQRLTGVGKRVSRVLVAPAPGHEREAKRALRELAGGRLDVRSSTSEASIVEQASKPNDQITGLFAGISAFVGLLFAVNAVLLSAPLRRRLLAHLHLQGFRRRTLLSSLLFDALVVGVIGCALGIGLGWLLSRHVFPVIPSYLEFAFATGTDRTVQLGTVAIAVAAGLLATMLATGRVALELVRGRAEEDALRPPEEPEARAPRGAQRRSLQAGLALVALTSVLALLAPGTTILAIAGLAVAAALILPAVLAGVVRALDRLAQDARDPALVLAVKGLSAAPGRAAALAVTGALAVFGSVAIEGAHRDVIRGLDHAQGALLGAADLWVTSGGTENTLMVDSFDAGELTGRLAAVDGVAAVRPWRASLLDAGDRRLWVIARDAQAPEVIPNGQLVEGDLEAAGRRMRTGGWAAISDVFARDRGLAPGDRFSLPTPTGTARFKVAALISNLDWAPGAVLLAASDYTRALGASAPSALQLDLRPGADVAVTRQAVQAALPAASGLHVQTARERTLEYGETGRRGLARLTQISFLALVAALLAMAAAISTSIWQRRPGLAALRLAGFRSGVLVRTLVIEIAIVVSVACVTGAVLGLYAQWFTTRWGSVLTGYPTIFSPAALLAVGLSITVAAVALLIGAVPGRFAARVEPSVAFRE